MKYHWIGHYKEGTSDKVWGLIRITDNQFYNDYVAFWGRRGKKLQTKIHNNIDHWAADSLSDKKLDGGYKSIDPNRLGDVYPEFEEDLQKTTVWALLKV